MSQGPVSFNDQGVQAPNSLIIFQFRNITNGSLGHHTIMYCNRVTYSSYFFTEGGRVELDWYEIGRVLAIDNETDYVYVGDTDIWPGMLLQFMKSTTLFS